jgi:murein DD-endopeptidase MepM/ murein hydrolase activator NlpD
MLILLMLGVSAALVSFAAREIAAQEKISNSDRDASRDVNIADAFTPVVARVLGPPSFFVRGTDGKYHVAYDVEFQNTRLPAATLIKVDVLDAANPSKVFASISGGEMVKRLRTLAARPVSDAGIEPNGGRVLFIELTLNELDQLPKTVVHRITLLGAAGPPATEPSPLEYTILPYDVAAAKPFSVGAPLAGKGWVAVNGCCAPGFPHRSSFLSLNGMLINAQRYAVDWLRLNNDGYLVSDDPSKNENWSNYGADVLAVADGTIVDTLDEMNDNTPGSLPDPSTINVKNVDGNHIVIDFGNGLYGFYAHLKRGSLKVRVGDKVKKGDRLAQLGNTGNSSAPHLHFHIMDGRSVLGSNAVPYTIEKFDYAGQIPLDLFVGSDNLTENFGKKRLASPQQRRREYPLAWDIINFP